MLAAVVKQAAFLLGNGYLAQAEQDGLFSPPILFSSVYRPYPIPSAQDRVCKKQSLQEACPIRFIKNPHAFSNSMLLQNQCHTRQKQIIPSLLLLSKTSTNMGQSCVLPTHYISQQHSRLTKPKPNLLSVCQLGIGL